MKLKIHKLRKNTVPTRIIVAKESPTERLDIHTYPIDKQAAKEIKEPQFERFTTRECPPLWPVPVNVIQRRVSHYRVHGQVGLGKFPDLTGQRLGKMIIIGLKTYREHRRSSWIARCDCGMYEQRSHRNWQKYYRLGVPDACQYCMSMEVRAVLIDSIYEELRKSGDPRYRPPRDGKFVSSSNDELLSKMGNYDRKENKKQAIISDKNPKYTDEELDKLISEKVLWFQVAGFIDGSPQTQG